MSAHKNIQSTGDRADENIFESSKSEAHDVQKSSEIPGLFSEEERRTHHGGQASCATLTAPSPRFGQKTKARNHIQGYLVSLVCIGLCCESQTLISLHYMMSTSVHTPRNYSPEGNAAFHGTKRYGLSRICGRQLHRREMTLFKCNAHMSAGGPSKNRQVLFHVAPMQCYTNRFFRALVRQMSDRAVLW
jgi:hypothetical protein